MAVAKAAAHWLLTGLPLVVRRRCSALLFDLTPAALGVAGRCRSLLGTPVLSLLGAIGAALTLGVRGGGVLLIAADAAALHPGADLRRRRGRGGRVAGQSARGHLLAARRAPDRSPLCFAPWATAAALRIAME